MAERWPTADRWISLHAFFRGDTDRLLTQAVGGLVRELSAEGRLDRFFFLRYWEGGPHVRLRLLPHSPACAALVEQRTKSTVEQHLAGHPTVTSWDRERYARLAERLAQLEGRRGYDRRLRPDGCVEPVPYRPEHDVFGGPEVTDAVERNFHDSSRLALAALGRDGDRGRLLGYASTALMLALAVWEPDPRRMGGLLARARDRWDPQPQRARRAEVFARQHEALTGQAERCWRVASCTDPAGARGLAGAWWRSLETLHQQVVAHQQAGRFHPARTGSTLRALDAGSPPERNDVLILLIRCVHLLCNRLGLSASDEGHLRYLTGATLGELAQKEGTP